MCPGLSPTQLSPGKYHKVPVPLRVCTQPQVAFTTLGRVLVLFLTTQSPLSPWNKSAALQGRCLHVSCALLCRKLPKGINVNTRDVQWQAESWSCRGQWGPCLVTTVPSPTVPPAWGHCSSPVCDRPAVAAVAEVAAVSVCWMWKRWVEQIQRGVSQSSSCCADAGMMP